MEKILFRGYGRSLTFIGRNNRLMAALIGFAAFGAVAVMSAQVRAVNVPGQSNTIIPHKPIAKSPEHKLKCPARFITCMAWDKFRHAVWIGTEGKGIYEYRPWATGTQRWKHFSKADSGSRRLADNSCYAIAVDNRARIWAGTDRHGVDVYVSRTQGWRRYDILPLAHAGKFGPLGSHPFCISFDPYTKAVWIGTEAGISIYSNLKRTWQYLTVSNGLPTNQISAIAFLPNHQVILGTQCAGLAIGTPTRTDNTVKTAGTWPGISALPQFHDTYHWRVMTGPFHTPARAWGNGLPSSLINAVDTTPPTRKTIGLSQVDAAKVARHQEVYVGTDSGLAMSRNGGQSWRYEQGQHYAARVLGLFHPPAGFRAPPQAKLSQLLSGEHITCIARDAAGNLWLGFWRDGYMVIGPHGKHRHCTDGDPRFAKTDTYVQAILPLSDGKVLIGRYGGGLSIIKPARLAKWLKPNTKLKFYEMTRPHHQFMPVMVKFPVAAATPSVHELRSLLSMLCKIHTDSHARDVIIPLADDWRTRGDELDNYGRLNGWMGAMAHIIDGATCGEPWFKSSFEGYSNPYWRKSDLIRRWISEKSTSNPTALQNPATGTRTMSSWDDHGETYPVADDGPNLYFTVVVPAGQYVLSLYFVNDTAHWAASADRDYTIDIRATPAMTTAVYDNLPFVPKPGIEAFASAPRLASSRVNVFWSGVYKRFFVNLPGTGYRSVTIRVRRNHSFNAEMSGIFIDRLYAMPRNSVVPPLLREHRPFRSYKAWENDPMPPAIIKKIERIIFSDIRRQMMITPTNTLADIRRYALSFAKQQMRARDDLRMGGYGSGLSPVEERRLTLTPAGRHRLMHIEEVDLSSGNRVAQGIIRQLLHLRTSNPAWFSPNAQLPVILLSRYLFARGQGGYPASALVLKGPPAGMPVFSFYYVASLLCDIGMPLSSKRVYFRPDEHKIFTYQWIERHGKQSMPTAPMAARSIFNNWISKQQKKEMLQWNGN